MNRILFSLLVVCFSALTATAQPDETLITIGKNKIGKAEFERIYKKNNNNLYNESDKKSPKDYLDLFINFKLKVIEAENLKMDTSKAFINELAGYRKDLAAPYLTDVKFNEQQVKEMYRRMTKEVNADHILFNVKPNATPEEEKTVYEKALKVRKEILAGKDFNEAAAGYSDDPSAKTNKGHLGYFSAFQMVAPFENGAFTTPVGEISQPIRSRFGYHLIKVNDVRENRGEIEVAHIMKMFPQGATNEVRRKLKAEIDSIYQLLQIQNGANFDELAKTLSDDKRSAAQGGKMPWFSDGRMVPEFADAAFAIKNCGEYTKPIETPFGYHIIKKLDFRPVPSFEKAKADIEKKIKKDPERSVSSKKAFIDKLKKEYRYTEYDKNIEKLKGKSPGDEISRKHLKLFTIDQKNYTVGDFEKFIQQKNIKTGTYFTNFEKWVEKEITKLEDSKLEEKYPDFRYMMKEYHDGILLFNISEQKIWNFAVQDSAGLEKFYKKNKGKYLWGERFKGVIVECKDEQTREEAEKYFASGMTAEEITDQLNSKKEMVVIKKGAWEKGSLPIIDYFVWNGPEPKYFNGAVTFVRGDKIPPEPKTLNEARGLYISDYQNYLEKNWIKKLRKKYRIKVNKKLLKTIASA